MTCTDEKKSISCFWAQQKGIVNIEEPCDIPRPPTRSRRGGVSNRNRPKLNNFTPANGLGKR